jgi:hypothetical protein
MEVYSNAMYSTHVLHPFTPPIYSTHLHKTLAFTKERMIGTNHISATLAAMALLTASPHAAALDRLITCPTELQPQAIKITAGAGWVPRIESPLNLYSAGMSAGPPGSQQTRPGRELRRDKEQISTAYAFDPDSRPNHVWLNCTYGEGGGISISRRLDERTRECTITMFKPVPGEPRKIDMKCG